MTERLAEDRVVEESAGRPTRSGRAPGTGRDGPSPDEPAATRPLAAEELNQLIYDAGIASGAGTIDSDGITQAILDNPEVVLKALGGHFMGTYTVYGSTKDEWCFPVADCPGKRTMVTDTAAAGIGVIKAQCDICGEFVPIDNWTHKRKAQ